MLLQSLTTIGRAATQAARAFSPSLTHTMGQRIHFSTHVQTTSNALLDRDVKKVDVNLTPKEDHLTESLDFLIAANPGEISKDAAKMERYVRLTRGLLVALTHEVIDLRDKVSKP